MDSLHRARWIALIVPAALLGGAYLSQYVGHLFPCEMCYWQRWPHMAAIGLALIAFMLRGGAARLCVVLAACAILVSGAIGIFHAGVEYHWWDGITACTSTVSQGSGSMLDRIMKAPLVRCDVPQWTLGPISLAGFNALFSITGGLAALFLALLGARR